jgi:hypothetical protein
VIFFLIYHERSWLLWLLCLQLLWQSNSRYRQSFYCRLARIQEADCPAAEDSSCWSINVICLEFPQAYEYRNCLENGSVNFHIMTQRTASLSDAAFSEKFYTDCCLLSGSSYCVAIRKQTINPAGGSLLFQRWKFRHVFRRSVFWISAWATAISTDIFCGFAQLCYSNTTV